MQQVRELPQKRDSAQAIFRFCVRLLILTAFAAFGSIGFGRSLVALLWMSTILCAVIGLARREPLLAPALNHWDEMITYGALCSLVQALSLHF
jgi:hypothetical protein